jgi:hypothetical protein
MALSTKKTCNLAARAATSNEPFHIAQQTDRQTEKYTVSREKKSLAGFLIFSVTKFMNHRQFTVCLEARTSKILLFSLLC